jgi:uncharacterized membrane-anchored protein
METVLIVLGACAFFLIIGLLALALRFAIRWRERMVLNRIFTAVCQIKGENHQDKVVATVCDHVLDIILAVEDYGVHVNDLPGVDSPTGFARRLRSVRSRERVEASLHAQR